MTPFASVQSWRWSPVPTHTPCNLISDLPCPSTVLYPIAYRILCHLVSCITVAPLTPFLSVSESPQCAAESQSQPSTDG